MLMLVGDRAESDQVTVPWLLNSETRFTGGGMCCGLGCSVYILLQPRFQSFSHQERQASALLVGDGSWCLHTRRSGLQSAYLETLCK